MSAAEPEKKSVMEFLQEFLKAKEEKPELNYNDYFEEHAPEHLKRNKKTNEKIYNIFRWIQTPLLLLISLIHPALIIATLLVCPFTYNLIKKYPLLPTEEPKSKFEKIKYFFIKHKISLLIIVMISHMNNYIGILALLVFLVSCKTKKQVVKQIQALRKRLDDLNNNVSVELTLFFIKTNNYRKKDDQLINKKNCILKIENDEFYIIQDEKQIENNIKSIYKMRYWVYEGYTYLVIKMRSHTEYMFGIDNKQLNELKLITSHLGITCDDDNNDEY